MNQDNHNLIVGTQVALFKGKQIRKVLVDGEWWFSVVDIAGALTDSVDPGAYWRKLKERLKEEGSEVVTNCHGLKLPAPDGKMRETDCADTEGIFRIIQSIPSSKAEPFKRWLAKVAIIKSASRELLLNLKPLLVPHYRVFETTRAEVKIAISDQDAGQLAYAG